ncbi:MAG: hypothetical protein ACF8PN_07985 [Phycisphaerales bacterium]
MTQLGRTDTLEAAAQILAVRPPGEADDGRPLGLEFDVSRTAEQLGVVVWNYRLVHTSGGAGLPAYFAQEDGALRAGQIAPYLRNARLLDRRQSAAWLLHFSVVGDGTNFLDAIASLTWPGSGEKILTSAAQDLYLGYGNTVPGLQATATSVPPIMYNIGFGLQPFTALGAVKLPHRWDTIRMAIRDDGIGATTVTWQMVLAWAPHGVVPLLK